MLATVHAVDSVQTLSWRRIRTRFSLGGSCCRVKVRYAQTTIYYSNGTVLLECACVERLREGVCLIHIFAKYCLRFILLTTNTKTAPTVPPMSFMPSFIWDCTARLVAKKPRPRNTCVRRCEPATQGHPAITWRRVRQSIANGEAGFPKQNEDTTKHDGETTCMHHTVRTVEGKNKLKRFVALDWPRRTAMPRYWTYSHVPFVRTQ